MTKKLKIWNGRGWGGHRYDDKENPLYDLTGRVWCDHAYVCAHSRAEAVRIINEAVGYDIVNDNELKVYWSEGCWGKAMEGITPELGVWTQASSNHEPIRIYPKILKK